MDYIQWFPRRLAQLRMEKGCSARDMSLSLGQSESYINKIENSRTMPSMIGFFYICEYFGITPGEFFDPEARSLQKTQELAQELKKLDVHEAQHVLQIIRDLNKKTKTSFE